VREGVMLRGKGGAAAHRHVLHTLPC
jgi:hypothetical protein